jgi:hypothetical protein
VPQRLWERPENAEAAEGVREYVGQADFRADVHFVVKMAAGHAGTEAWGGCTAHMRFPLPPEQMDAWVQQSVVGREALEKHEALQQRSSARTAGPGPPPGPGPPSPGCGCSSRGCALQLSTARRAWDRGKGRFSVRLSGGREICVKPENFDVIV